MLKLKSLALLVLVAGCTDYSKPLRYISTSKFEIFKQEKGLERDLEITKQGFYHLRALILSVCLSKGYSNYFLFEETKACKSRDEQFTTEVECSAMARCVE